jgi:hypothetical protein
MISIRTVLVASVLLTAATVANAQTSPSSPPSPLAKADPEQSSPLAKLEPGQESPLAKSSTVSSPLPKPDLPQPPTQPATSDDQPKK